MSDQEFEFDPDDYLDEAPMGVSACYANGYALEQLAEGYDHISLNYFSACKPGDYPDTETFLEPPRCCHGDYYGSGALGRANRRAFLDEHGHKPGVITVFSCCGYEGVLVSLDTYKRDYAVRETFDTLDNYLILDDQLLFEEEQKDEEEAWESWGRREFAEALGKRFQVELEYENQELDGIFWDTLRESNECWNHEQDGAWMNVAAVADEADPEGQGLKVLLVKNLLRGNRHG